MSTNEFPLELRLAPHSAQLGMNPCLEVAGSYRLENEFISPHLRPPGALFRARTTSHEKHWDVLGGRIQLDHAAGFETILFGHDNVHEDEIRGSATTGFEGIRAIGRHKDLELILEHFVEELNVHGLVVDNQDFGLRFRVKFAGT